MAKSRQAVGRLNRFVQEFEAALPALPLTHTTKAYSFGEILPAETLEPQMCKILKEELIYLFYGKPAYRVKNNDESNVSFDWPIVFIFKPDVVLQIKRVMPFDTGAFANQLYSDFFDRDSQLSDFELDTSTESATKLVSGFYTSNEEYLLGRSTKNVDISPMEFEARGIHEMARKPSERSISSAVNRDDRSTTVEVQASAPISLKGSIMALLAPNAVFDDVKVIEALDRWQVADPIPYFTLPNFGNEVWAGHIYAKVAEYYASKGILADKK